MVAGGAGSEAGEQNFFACLDDGGATFGRSLHERSAGVMVGIALIAGEDDFGLCAGLAKIHRHGAENALVAVIILY